MKFIPFRMHFFPRLNTFRMIMNTQIVKKDEWFVLIRH
jgi:hypothetical protein